MIHVRHSWILFWRENVYIHDNILYFSFWSHLNAVVCTVHAHFIRNIPRLVQYIDIAVHAPPHRGASFSTTVKLLVFLLLSLVLVRWSFLSHSGTYTISMTIHNTYSVLIHTTEMRAKNSESRPAGILLNAHKHTTKSIWILRMRSNLGWIWLLLLYPSQCSYTYTAGWYFCRNGQCALANVHNIVLCGIWCTCNMEFMLYYYVVKCLWIRAVTVQYYIHIGQCRSGGNSHSSYKLIHQMQRIIY